MAIPSRRRLGVSNDLTFKPKPKFDLQDLDNLQAHVHHQTPNLILIVVNMKTKGNCFGGVDVVCAVRDDRQSLAFHVQVNQQLAFMRRSSLDCDRDVLTSLKHL